MGVWAVRPESVIGTGLQKALQMVAPGTALRVGLENVVKAKTGALIVVGDTPEIMNLVNGGFRLDCEYSPANLYELAKMDGAIIMNADATRILVANAQLVPDISITSIETGIRHRTAERVAKQTGELVIAISQRRGMITLYKGNFIYVLRDIGTILAKANQALQTLEKYRNVLEKDLIRLGGTEFEDMATVNDICRVLRRCIMVLKVGQEIENYIIELGVEGRLVKMQLDELLTSVEEEAISIVKDYSRGQDRGASEILGALLRSFEEDVSDYLAIAKALGFGSAASVLEQHVSPRGYRILQKLPRIPSQVIDNLVATFGSFSNIIRASIEELDDVEGIGEVRARSIRNGLKRMQEQLILEYMV
ncbi:DNA integrity scanning diadenylate cyclase DisA [Syntrophothermus lipocalidus]|uniref:DNA integrity scanning protein DisA n=1 Tax=Syntrophothermus lipocalidus (strain DSM 12680 / TGB-C1) TaxID=643648 RepID=D7CJQ2_SYNLT|nr:DNA integrity scanning diadenylate cyclase DisA [Syntrophothermus lipocalidus]ADI03007.1 DNA integrity scanning, DisA, linker region [Syntrophothermus lipocalidus DSM 12680]